MKDQVREQHGTHNIPDFYIKQEEILEERNWLTARELRQKLQGLFNDDRAHTTHRSRGAVVRSSREPGAAAEVFVANGHGFTNVLVVGTVEYGYNTRVDEDFQLKGDANVGFVSGTLVDYFSTLEGAAADETEEVQQIIANALRGAKEYDRAVLDKKKKVRRGIGKRLSTVFGMLQ